MATEIQELRTDINAMRTAIRNGDYVTALRHATAVQATLVGIPRSKLEEEEIEFNPQSIGQLIGHLQGQANAQQATSSGGLVQQVPMRVRRS